MDYLQVQLVSAFEVVINERFLLYWVKTDNLDALVNVVADNLLEGQV